MRHSHKSSAGGLAQRHGSSVTADDDGVGDGAFWVPSSGSDGASRAGSLGAPPPSPSRTDEIAYINGITPGGVITNTSFWGATGGTAHKFGSTTAGTGATISYTFAAASNFSATEKETFRTALDMWSAVADVTFIEGTAGENNSGVKLVRGGPGSGENTSRSFSNGSGSTLGQPSGQYIINVETGAGGFDLSGSLNDAYGGYGMSSIIHEVGHLLGLGHGGNYNQPPPGQQFDPGPSQHGVYDERMWTTMSYVDWTSTTAAYKASYPVTGTNWGPVTAPHTWMQLDVVAIQQLYGAATTTPFSGGQIFGFNTNITGRLQKFFDFTQNHDPVVTLFDEGTGNTLDLSGYASASTVDLNGGAFSSVGGHVNNLSIAVGTVIETAFGGSAGDTITGNDLTNDLEGNAGNDTLHGGKGEDLLEGGAGADTLDGGDGNDIVSYRTSTAPVSVNLSTGAVSGGHAQGDTLASVEGIRGSEYDDTLTGDGGNNAILGGKGNDTIDGGAGDDILYGYSSLDPAVDGDDRFFTGTGADIVYGNAGNDTARFDDIDTSHDDYDGGAGTGDLLVLDWSGATTAVRYGAAGAVASTALGSAESYTRSGVPGTADTGQTISFKNVERFAIGGGSADDVLVGGAGDDVLSGNDGNDGLNGGSGGADVLDGGAGTDTATIVLSGGNNVIDLKKTETATGLTLANGTTLISIEAMNLVAGSGNDTLDVRGTVTLDPTALAAGEYAGGARTEFSGQGGDDTLAVDLGTSLGAHFDGGDGIDTLVMDWSDATHAVQLANAGLSNQAYQSYAYTITVHTNGSDDRTDYYYSAAFQNVEKFDLTGGKVADRLIGGASDDRLNPGHGYGDQLDGKGGTDTLVVDYSDDGYGIGLTISADPSGGYAGNVGNGNSTGYDYAAFTGVEAFSIRSGSGNDVIRSGAGADVISTGAGDDAVSAGEGADTVDLGTGTNSYEDDLHAQTASVILDLTNLTAVQSLGNGGGTVRGASNVTLTTGSGADTISTRSDFLVDHLTTGAGNDTVKLAGGYGDSADMGAGTDTLVVDYSDDGYGIGLNISADPSGGYTGNVGNGNSTGYDYAAFTGVEVFSIRSGSGGDSLTTGNGADTLDGGAGADTLTGGGGNDAYVVDDAGDMVIEAVRGGTDTVRASASYALAAGQEIEILRTTSDTGTKTIALTGNAFANAITGNAGTNLIDGGAGVDMLYGLGGNDTYLVDSASDKVFEAAGGGTDTVKTGVGYALAAGQEIEALSATGTAAVFLTGNEFANTITGNSGANLIKGGLGNDVLNGGGGIDTVDYSDKSAAVVVTLDGASAVSVKVGGAAEDTISNIENVTGGSAADTLTGDGLANVLDGGRGADTLKGLAGNDTYLVDSASDKVFEAAGGGRDTVKAGVSYVLAAAQEIETLATTLATGTGALNLTGNEFANTITGNAGVNALAGGSGADILTGLAGSDTFVFDTALGSANVDRITDFVASDTAIHDVIDLARSIFAKAGTAGQLADGAFKDVGVTGAAVDGDDRILYNSKTGALSYDADGSAGASSAIQFARLDNHAVLTAHDFFLV